MSNPGPSCLYSGNADFIEELYEKFLQNPQHVDSEWRGYFTQLQAEDSANKVMDVPHSHVRQQFYEAAKNKRAAIIGQTGTAKDTIAHQKQASVLQLINAHRFRGHNQANLDPLNLYQRPEVPELDPSYHNLTESDMDSTFNTGSLFAPNEISLREIIDIIKTTYCQSIGAEYMYINDTEQKRWIQKRLEECRATPGLRHWGTCLSWRDPLQTGAALGLGDIVIQAPGYPPGHHRERFQPSQWHVGEGAK